MNLLLISSSVVHGYGYLDHSESALRELLAKVSSVGFVPYALQNHDDYVQKVRDRMAAWNLTVTQIETPADVEAAEAIFIGGGNTFRLLKTLYERGLIEPIRARARGGMPYIGSSAGTNVATPSIKTTNDMPIVLPPTFDALGLVPFQINPHYLDPDPNSTHKGETREDRIREFHEENDAPVVGLREGSMLRVRGEEVRLLGEKPVRLFLQGQEPEEMPPGVLKF